MTIRHWRRRVLGLAGAVLTTTALAQSGETLIIKRPAELREAAAETSRSLMPLGPQTPVSRLGSRQGPWIEVRTAQGQTGWIHMFDAGLPPQQAQGNTASGALRGITSLFGGGSARPAATTATSTIGIRGLGAEELANAQPNMEAVAQVESMRQTSTQARGFGTLAQLQPRAVEPLPVPTPPARSAPSAGGSTTPGGVVTGGDR